MTWRIPLIRPDLPSLEDVEDEFREILESGRITNFGKYVTAFEQEVGAYLGADAVTVSSGTMALLLTLNGLGVRAGEKIILPSFTFIATAQAVIYAGGVPVFAEVDDDLTMSVPDVEDLLATHSDVSAVIGVHTYGLPCRTRELERVVREAAARLGRPIHVVYDAAHALGSATGCRRVGTFGDAEVFSLSVTKVLVSVEGGLISSRDAGLIDRLRKMRNYGIEHNYNAHWPGLNGKMSEFHAVIALHNLRRLDGIMAERQQKARYYLDGIRSATRFETMAWPKGIVHTCKDLTIVLPPSSARHREALVEYCRERGIETRAYFFPPVHEQEYFRRFADRPLPRTEAMARRVLTLPFYTTMSEADIDYVVATLAEAERAVL